MKDPLASSGFNTGHYERPNQKWVCGKAESGLPCHSGPDQRGRCRVSHACKPVLDRKEGEAKGRYRCTRPRTRGGACETGPMPDGTCCLKLPPCQPVRSLQARRGVWTRAVVILTVALLLVLMGGPLRNHFISPNHLSEAHAGLGFLRVMQRANDAEGCSACHVAATRDAVTWLDTALRSDPGMLDFKTLIGAGIGSHQAMDLACQQCHTQHSFHQPNVQSDVACSTCHVEHQGPGPMATVEDRHCGICHGSPEIMKAAALAGREIDKNDFPSHLSPGITWFPQDRPPDGYTKVIHAFDGDHPEFSVHSPDLQDDNSLRFNHQRHFQNDIYLLQTNRLGEVTKSPLNCANCHLPDASKGYHQKINFDLHCRKCHELQFDSTVPDLTLPHGRPDAVRAFLSSLPRQYADYARRVKGVTRRSEVEVFVRQSLDRLEAERLTGQDLEARVFYSTEKTGPAPGIGSQEQVGRSEFHGCAYCHEVKPDAQGQASVVPPSIPNRWMAHLPFNHESHGHLGCLSCHAANLSRKTSDILLPRKRICIACHSPQGGVSHGCITCHQFHNWLSK